MNKKAVSEIRRRILAASPKGADTSAIARYIGSVGHEKRAADEQSRLQFLGLSVREIRELAQTRFSFSDEPPAAQMQIWSDAFHAARTYEEQSVAVEWFAHRSRRHASLLAADLLFKLQSSVDNWAISDSLAALVAEALESNPKLLSRLTRWNTSKHPWERRQSLVGLYYYARLRQRRLPAKKALSLIERLLDDPHYFVQKGVGWSLREVYQVDPMLQTEFLYKHLARISGVAFAAAAEKHPAAERAKLIRARKELRRAKK